MIWLSRHRSAMRTLALILFLLALSGPWMFDRIHVPAEYACSAPNIRLEGDFCGLPMPGFKVIFWFALGLIDILARLLTRANMDLYRLELFSILAALFFAIPILPFVSNLLLLFKRSSHSLQTTSLIFWMLACMLSIPLFVSGLGPQANQLWGLWLYIGLTVAMLCAELVLRLKS